jgi:hypothetical protein
MPCGHCQKLARAVAECTVRGCQPIETALHLVERCGIDAQHGGADDGQILQRSADGRIGGQRIIGFHRFVGSGLDHTGSGAQPRQHRIAAGCPPGELVESGLRLGVLALLAQGDRLLERGASSGSLLPDPPLIAAPRGNPGDDEERDRDDVDAVAVPQLFQLFAADCLVELIKFIGHERLQIG